MRIFLELVAEGVIDKRAAALQLLFCGLGHLANDGFFHPFTPLVNRKCERRRRRIGQKVVREIKRDAVAIAHRIEHHLAHHHAAGAIQAFKAELFNGTTESRFRRLGSVFLLVALCQGVEGAVAEARIRIAYARFALVEPELRIEFQELVRMLGNVVAERLDGIHLVRDTRIVIHQGIFARGQTELALARF